jgi:hypothetical protein
MFNFFCYTDQRLIALRKSLALLKMGMYMKNKILLLALASLFAMQASASLFKKIVGRRAIVAKKLTPFAIAQRYLLKQQLKEITKNIHAKQTRLDKVVPFLPYPDFLNEGFDLQSEIHNLEEQALSIKKAISFRSKRN